MDPGDKGGLSKLFPKYILETDAGVRSPVSPTEGWCPRARPSLQQEIDVRTVLQHAATIQLFGSMSCTMNETK